jgi:hypothetical protein
LADQKIKASNNRISKNWNHDEGSSPTNESFQSEKFFCTEKKNELFIRLKDSKKAESKDPKTL